MALNPNLLFAGAPANLSPAEIAHTNAMTQGQNLANTLSGMKIQQEQKAMQDQNMLTALARGRTDPSGNFDRQGFVNDVMRVDPMKGTAIAQRFAQEDQDAAKARLALQEAHSKMSAEQREQMNAEADTIARASEYINAGASPQDKAMRWDDVAKQINKPELVGRYDPQMLAKYQGLSREWLKIQSDKAKEALERDKMEQGQWDTFNTTEGVVGFNKKTFETRKTGFKPIPPAAAAGGSVILTPEAKDMLVEKYLRTGVLDGDLGRNPALRAEIVNAAAARGGTDLAGAKQQYRTIDEARKYWTTGRGADAFRQQETIIHHADQFIKVAEALQGGNVQLANKLGAQFGAQFGSDQATNFKIVSQIMSAEVGKYLAGGQSTEGERSELSNLIPVFASPQQARSGLQTLKNLVEGQRKSWTAQRDAALSGRIPGVEAPTSQKRLSPEEARSLPAGTKFIGLDGVERTKR